MQATRAGPDVRPDRATFRDLGRTWPLVPVWAELLADVSTPVGVFLSLAGAERGALLESVERSERWGRYSFVAGEPAATLVVEGGGARLDDVRRDLPADPGPATGATGALENLQRFASALRAPKLADLPALTGGLVGYLAYEAASLLDGSPHPGVRTPCPPMAFHIVDRAVVFDHWRQRLLLVAHIPAGGDAVLIDGAAEPERILAHLEGLRVVAILETHNHPDHTAALPALVEAVGARVLAHPDDPMPVESEPLAGGETMPVGRAELSVLHTPGHTAGSLCFVLRSPGEEAPRLFTGDTLFPGGPGNTSGDSGRFARIMRSLEDLFAFPDATGVSPGHGLDTTIGRERPHVETWRARGW